MKVLDIDLDFFLKEIPEEKFEMERYPDDECEVWERNEVISYLEDTLKLTKKNKIKGRIVVKHNESLDFWNEQIEKGSLIPPFQIIHVDSHSDIDYRNRNIDDESELARYLDILSLPKVADRYHLIYKSSSKEMHDKWVKEGNYLIFAIAFEWTNNIVYCANTSDEFLEELEYPSNFIIERGKDENNIRNRILSLANSDNGKKYKIEYKIITKNQENESFGKYDFITFAISPKFTPKKADFIIDIIKEYIEEI